MSRGGRNKITQEQWVEEASIAHNGKYSYERVEYRSLAEKVEVLCPLHGSFWQNAGHHRRGIGCPGCKAEKIGGLKRSDVATFVSNATEVHGGRYDYSEVVYAGRSKKVSIGCVTHGSFVQTPAAHLRGQGCPKCAEESRAARSRSRKLTLDSVRSRLSVIREGVTVVRLYHEGNSAKLEVRCSKHGAFTISVANAMRAVGCAKCRHEGQVLTTADFIARARRVHGQRYGYATASYQGSQEQIRISCATHGEFEQVANTHLDGSGCPECAKSAIGERIAITFDEFVERAQAAHGGKYTYSRDSYTRISHKTRVTCATHGSFFQNAKAHTIGAGCPRCATKVSKAEDDLAEYIRSLGHEIRQSDRSVIAPKELDITIPALKFAVEYNGLYYHSDVFDGARLRHLEKTRAAQAAGWRVVHVFEDEWRDRQDAVKATLAALTGKRPTLVAARKADLVRRPAKEIRAFLEAHHLQGATRGGIAYCLEHNGALAAVMVFAKVTSERGAVDAGYELTRYCTAGGVPGGAARLFKAFLKDYPGQRVVSYSDNRWFDGGMYAALGFAKTHATQPNYFVVVGTDRMHKSNFRHERLKDLLGPGYDATKTERELCHENGWFRIYDCGLTKWEYGQTMTGEASS